MLKKKNNSPSQMILVSIHNATATNKTVLVEFSNGRHKRDSVYQGVLSTRRKASKNIITNRVGERHQ